MSQRVQGGKLANDARTMQAAGEAQSKVATAAQEAVRLLEAAVRPPDGDLSGESSFKCAENCHSIFLSFLFCFLNFFCSSCKEGSKASILLSGRGRGPHERQPTAGVRARSGDPL